MTNSKLNEPGFLATLETMRELEHEELALYAAISAGLVGILMNVVQIKDLPEGTPDRVIEALKEEFLIQAMPRAGMPPSMMEAQTEVSRKIERIYNAKMAKMSGAN